MALPARFERATCGLGNRRSIHLSYGSNTNIINDFISIQADKELARRRLEALRQKVARLNTKAGKVILFADLAKRWLDNLSGMQWFISIRDGRSGCPFQPRELAHKGTNMETALRMRWGRHAVVVDTVGFEAEAVGFVGESTVVLA